MKYLLELFASLVYLVAITNFAFAQDPREVDIRRMGKPGTGVRFKR
jgi:hypothetical protein